MTRTLSERHLRVIRLLEKTLRSNGGFATMLEYSTAQEHRAAVEPLRQATEVFLRVCHEDGPEYAYKAAPALIVIFKAMQRCATGMGAYAVPSDILPPNWSNEIWGDCAELYFESIRESLQM